MYRASLFVATHIAQDVLCKSSVFATWIAKDVLFNKYRSGCTVPVYLLQRRSPRMYCANLRSSQHRSPRMYYASLCRNKYRSGCTMPVCICCKADGPGCTMAVLFVAGPVLRPQTPVLEGRGGRVQDRSNSSTGRVCSQYVSVSLHPLLCLISACALLNVFRERLRSLCNRVCCLFMTRWLSRVKCIPS